MTLPKWNPAWDPPDPLKGRLGWCGRHRVNTIVAVLFLVFVLLLMVPGALLPAFARLREKRARMEAVYQIVQEAVEKGAYNTFQTE